MDIYFYTDADIPAAPEDNTPPEGWENILNAMEQDREDFEKLKEIRAAKKACKDIPKPEKAPAPKPEAPAELKDISVLDFARLLIQEWGYRTLCHDSSCPAVVDLLRQKYYRLNPVKTPEEARAVNERIVLALENIDEAIRWLKRKFRYDYDINEEFIETFKAIIFDIQKIIKNNATGEYFAVFDEAPDLTANGRAVLSDILAAVLAFCPSGPYIRLSDCDRPKTETAHTVRPRRRVVYRVIIK